jgi:3-(methylthio)propanoyl-CoA dehydrogenase
VCKAWRSPSARCKQRWIIEHADVKRMLLAMKSRTEAMRALAYFAALELDVAHRSADEAGRKAALLRAELLIPVVKAWCTETAVDVTSLGVQVHGGMGYVEETGVAQTLRDVRIASIYEGTTGIQANDLIGRKLGRDQGAAMQALLTELRAELTAASANGATAKACVSAAVEALTQLAATSIEVLRQHVAAPERAQAIAVPFLKLCGVVMGGALMARAAVASEQALAKQPDEAFYQAKLQTCRFYTEQVLPEAEGLSKVVAAGSASVAEARSELI